jgi:xylulokinase
MKKNMVPSGMTYDEMNALAAQSPAGAKGISVIPFGNGAERVLENRNVDCSFRGINFNIHNLSDMLRAAQEGIVFSFQYGMEIMQGMGMDIHVIRAGNANMFLSPLFRETLANISGAVIELFDTDGAAGAAKAAGMGAGIYASNMEAFSSLKKIMTVEPDPAQSAQYQDAYQRWKSFI